MTKKLIEVVLPLEAINAEAGGHDKCAALMAALSGETVEKVKTLAYRIYQICERKNMSDEALAYNNLVASWGI